MTDKERLTKVLESAIAEFVVCNSDGKPVTSYPAKMVVEDCESLLADHLLANGVTKLPWKIGDEFWTEWVGIRKVRCSMLTQKADGTWKGRFTVENSGGAGIDVAFDKSERRLFRTKEEAEAAFLSKEE